MQTGLEPLISDFVEWIAKEPRAYVEVLDAWRTSCPRLTVFEDATDQGLVERCATPAGLTIIATPEGRAFLQATRSR